MTRIVRFALAASVAPLLLSGCGGLKLLSQAEVLSVDSSQVGSVEGSATTGQFSVPAKWQLNVKYDCSKQKSEGIAGVDTFDMIVYNGDDDSENAEHPELHLTGRKKTMSLTFKRGGTFYFNVDSRCDWNLRVLDRSVS